MTRSSSPVTQITGWRFSRIEMPVDAAWLDCKDTPQRCPNAFRAGNSMLTRAAMREVLATLTLFAGLSRPDLELLASLATERRVRHDELVVRRNDPGDSLLVLVIGRLRAGAISPDGRELTHNVMQAGAVFGEIALLDGRARSVDVTAMEDSVLLELSRTAFIPFLRDRPELMLRLMAVLCDRLRRTSAAFEDVALSPLPIRLARLLLNLAEEHGKPVPQGIRIHARLSQSDLSTQVASSRESVNKQLRQWRGQGLITDVEGDLVLCRPESLRALLERSA